MKKLIALIVPSLCMAAPSFAGDVVGHSAKAVGKGTAKAATVAAKGTAKGVKAVREVSLLIATDKNKYGLEGS